MSAETVLGHSFRRVWAVNENIGVCSLSLLVCVCV